MQLRLPMIFAKDLSRMTAFYRDGIGHRFLPERSNEWWAEFEAGSAMFALHAIPEQIAESIEITSPPKARTTSPIKLVFETPDLEATRSHLVAHGAVMFETQSWGAYDGLDPEGNVFQIMKV